MFETGNTLEPVIERILAEIGRAAEPAWRIVQQQSPVVDDFLSRYQITGHIDGILQQPDERFKNRVEWVNYAVPDIKTCNPYIWEQLNTYDDLARYPWTRKWRGQLMIYALGNNLDKCMLILVNKTNLYQIKPIEFDLDYEYTENLLRRAEQVNAFVKAGTNLPAQHVDMTECSRCQFAHICNPPLESTGNLELRDDKELEDLLEERNTLTGSATRYKQIEKQLEQRLVKGQKIICGDFVVLWTRSDRKMSAQPERVSEVYKKKILYTKSEGDSDG